ncbi:hypothetical protein DFH29DRAFT_1084509 [Suillus ampliporus]|nr:hypothetical protein DFH29DRAFT_1084509 [Suillus ampliporus]
MHRASGVRSPLLPADPTPIINHAAQASNQTYCSWLAITSVSAIYFAAELCQLTSPGIALPFLDLLLENAEHVEKVLDETLDRAEGLEAQRHSKSRRGSEELRYDKA